jgi:Zn-dependent protease with chaperone function
MDFFERQRMARADTRRLVLLFTVAVIAIVAAVDALVLVALGFDVPPQTRSNGIVGLATDHAPALAIAALVTIALIAITSLVRTAQLRQGGSAVAQSLGGTEIPAQSRDLNHQRLRNVVEEVAIASGVPVPKIYVLEREPGINAFAAGFGTADAAVAVTRGTLETLNRDELQGVIAHEFSHILNGDMRLNLRLIGWLAGITLLAVAGRLLMRARGRNAGGIVMFGVGLFIIGSLGLLCARLIKAGISRKREYLADASAVQFTRQTQGIAGALKKIAANAHGSKFAAADGEEVSHLLFGDGVGYSRLFATHPPLEERIRALEPSFKLADLAAWAREQRRDDTTRAVAERRRAPLPDIEFTRVLGEAGQPIPAPVVIAGLAVDASTAMRPGQVVDQVGNPVSDDYRTAGLLHSRIPQVLNEAAHRPEHAAALLAGLLIGGDPGSRGRQRELLENALGAEGAALAMAYSQACSALHPMQRLPLAEIAFASLRRLPAVDMQRTRALVEVLIAADGEVTLFEYCLGFLLTRQIGEALSPGRRVAQERFSLKQREEAVGRLLSLLATAGDREGAAAVQAFAAGVAELGHDIAPRFERGRGWHGLNEVFLQLDQLKPAAKSLLVAAMTRTVMHDDQLDVAEAELLRTACAALHCPLPPLLHEARTRLAGLPTVE